MNSQAHEQLRQVLFMQNVLLMFESAQAQSKVMPGHNHMIAREHINQFCHMHNIQPDCTSARLLYSCTRDYLQGNLSMSKLIDTLERLHDAIETQLENN